MRKQTIQQIRDAVARIENGIKNYEPDYEFESLKKAVDAVYTEFTDTQDDTNGYSRAVRLDGKEAIIEEIEAQIEDSEIIKIKTTAKEIALNQLRAIVKGEHKTQEWMKKYDLHYVEGYDHSGCTALIADLEKFIKDHE